MLYVTEGSVPEVNASATAAGGLSSKNRFSAAGVSLRERIISKLVADSLFVERGLRTQIRCHGLTCWIFDFTTGRDALCKIRLCISSVVFRASRSGISWLSGGKCFREKSVTFLGDGNIDSCHRMG